MELRTATKGLKVFGIIFAIFGFGFLIAAIFLTNYHINCIKNWDECEATIINIYHEDESIKISYSFDGKTYQKEVGYYSSLLDINDVIFISVNPNDANNIYVHKMSLVFIVFYILGGMAFIVGISIFTVHILKENNKKKCLEYGAKKVCKNVEIVRSNTTSNDKRLYYFSVIYQDKKMKSEMFYFDHRLNDFVNPIINIYFLESGKYYIDINSIREDEFSNF